MSEIKHLGTEGLESLVSKLKGMYVNDVDYANKKSAESAASAASSKAEAEAAAVSAASAKEDADTAQAVVAEWGTSSSGLKHDIEQAIQTAGDDHTQAGSDHGTATADHTQAGADHTQAESDHATSVAQQTTFETNEAAREKTASDQRASEDATFQSKEAARDAAIEKVTDMEDEVAQIAQNVGDLSSQTIKSKNAIKGGYLDSTGNIVENDEYAYTDYLPVTPNYNIHWIYGVYGDDSVTEIDAILYDTNKTKIDNYGAMSLNERDIAITSHSDAAYIRFSFKVGNTAKAYYNDNDKTIIVDGLVYEESLNDKINTNSSNISILDSNISDTNAKVASLDEDVEELNENVFGVKNATKDKYWNVETLTDLEGYVASDEFVELDTPITSGDVLVWHCGVGNSTQALYISFYNSDKERIDFWGNIGYYNEETKSVNRTYTYADAKYVKLSGKYNGTDVPYLSVNGTIVWKACTIEGIANDIENIKDFDNERVTNATSGYYLAYDEENKKDILVEDADYMYSDYIPVQKGDTIVWNHGSGMSKDAKLILYDENECRDYLSPIETYRIYTINYDVVSMRFSILKSNADITKVTVNGEVVFSMAYSGEEAIPTKVQSFAKLRIAEFNEGGYNYGTSFAFPSLDAYNKAKGAWKNAISGLLADIYFACEHSMQLVSGETTYPSYDAFYKQFYPYHFEVCGSMALFSKFRLYHQKTITFTSGRRYISAYVTICGRIVRLICYHPVTNDTTDANDLVAECANDKYVIIGSDSNDVDGSIATIMQNAGYQTGNRGYWGEVYTCVSIANPIAIDTFFVKGFQINSFTTYHQIFKCKTANADETFTIANWEAIKIQDANFPVTDIWEASKSYNVGDVVTYQGVGDNRFATTDHQPVTADITTAFVD